MLERTVSQLLLKHTVSHTVEPVAYTSAPFHQRVTPASTDASLCLAVGIALKTQS